MFLTKQCFVAVCCATFCLPALAQKKSQNDTTTYATPSVTVTSTKATEGKSPVTFSEITKADLQRAYSMQDVPKLLADLPSTVFYSENGNAVGYSYISMRGFDQRRISVLINGIPQNDPEDHNVYWINFPDLLASAEDIQVQRGAGLVNYGAAAIGGSINITAGNFANQRFVRLTSGIGLQEFSGRRNTLAQDISEISLLKNSLEVSSGLIGEKYALYARVSSMQSRGYRDLSWAQLQSYFLSAVRFDDMLTTQINVFGGPVQDGLAYTGVPKQYLNNVNLRLSNDSYWEYDSTGRNVAFTVGRREQEIENFSQPHFEILNEFNADGAYRIKSSLFYYTGDGFFDFDASWADASTLRLNKEYSGLDSVGNPGNTIVRAFVANRHGGWIPRLILPHGDGSELTIGAELRWHRSLHYSTIRYAENLPQGFNPNYRIYTYNGVRNIYSVFAREITNVSSDMQATIEAQVVHTTYGIEGEKAGNIYTQYLTTDGTTVGNGGMLFSKSYVFVNPRFGLNWKLQEHSNAYLNLAYTSREPRMNNLYKADEAYSSGAAPLFASDTTGGVTRYNFSEPLIKPERMIDVELGLNTREATYSYGATLYWMEFFDELVRSGRRDIFGNPIDGNAPRVRHMGVELQASAMLFNQGTHSLQLGANATVSRNRIIEYNYQRGTATLNLADNPVSSFPDILANLRLTHSIYGVETSLTAKYVGEMYSDNFGNNIALYNQQGAGIGYADNKIEAYAVLNATISYSLQHVLSLQSIRAQLHINNLTNNLYAASANGAEFFPAAERNWYLGLQLNL